MITNIQELFAFLNQCMNERKMDFGEESNLDLKVIEFDSSLDGWDYSEDHKDTRHVHIDKVIFNEIYSDNSCLFGMYVGGEYKYHHTYYNRDTGLMIYAGEIYFFNDYNKMSIIKKLRKSRSEYYEGLINDVRWYEEKYSELTKLITKL